MESHEIDKDDPVQAADALASKLDSSNYCECGGEMLEGICLACGWWPGREGGPGELINGQLCDCQGLPMKGD